MKDYCMTVILWSFHCNNDNLTFMLYQENRSYPDEERFFIDKFKFGSVSGKSAALVAF